MSDVTKIRLWSVCLLVWIVGSLSWGLAESEQRTSYDALCDEASLDRDNIAAWIEIVNEEFCLPIMQHPRDDSYYSTHDVDGEESVWGALYTQAAYNSKDFSDPVTIVYGSSKLTGAPFRDLQELYSGQFEDCRKILLHLPEETRQYEVFAAVPYSSIHILHYYNFASEQRFESFFNAVYSTRLLGMHLVEDSRPEFGDKVLILSTGLRGDNMQRYLVMAKLVADEQ